MKEISWFRIVVYVVVIYVVSHSLMLLVYGAWWDDMLQWNVSSQMLESFLGADNFNNPFIYYPIKWIATIEDMKLMTFVYRVLPFLCWFISITSFFIVVKKITNNKTLTLYSSLLAASSGLNKTMLMICCYHYSISIALFMLGLCFFVYDYKRSSNWYKSLTMLFWLSSLLVFRPAVLVIPVVVLIACITKIEFNWKRKEFWIELVKYGIKNYYLIILGLFIFVGLYTTVLAPKGAYNDYYHVDLPHILVSPVLTITSCISVFFQYISSIFSAFARVGNMFVFSLLLLPFVYISLKKLEKGDIKKQQSFGLFVIALIVLVFSIMPHKLIGDSYSLCCDMENQNSRQASLAIFPIAVIMAYFIICLKDSIRPIVASVIITGSILFSNYILLDYERGWARNEAIAQFLSEHKELDGKKIMIYNDAMDYSIFRGTGDSYYEYEGCARLAYGRETKTEFKSFYISDEFRSDFKPDYYLQFVRKDEAPPKGVNLIFERIFRPEQYKETIKQMLYFTLSDSPIIE